MSVPAAPPFDPELAAVLEVVRSQFSGTPSLESLPAIRQAPIGEPIDVQLAGHDVEWFDRTISGYEGAPIEVTVFRKHGHVAKGPGILHIHGGGMISGNRFIGATVFGEWIERHDAVVVSVEYRLAPEHPDPYPVEDCYAGLVWTADAADELGIDLTRLMVVGGSAGGGLAAGVALLARDRKGPALAAQLLMCPMIDDRDATVSTRQIDGIGLWDRATNQFGWSALLGEKKGGDDVSIYAAPARARDLSNLPPTFIDAGSAEVFRDEAVTYATRIWEAGGNAELHVWAGGFHGFEMVAHAAISKAAVAARNNWVDRMLGT